MTESGLELFCEELERVSVSDAANMLVMMIEGPPSDVRDPRAKEQVEAMFRLAKIGMVCVMNKKDLIGIVREHGTSSDDTTLEDNLVAD
jgi:hypothetical protein